MHADPGYYQVPDCWDLMMKVHFFRVTGNWLDYNNNNEEVNGIACRLRLRF